MNKKLRYGDYLSTVRARQRPLSLNAVHREVERVPARARLRFIDVQRLLLPYVGVRLADQIAAVVPLALFLALFAAIVLRTTVDDAPGAAVGILAVIIGLMLFMEGIAYGLMPFAESIGYRLPSGSTRTTIVAVAFVIGAAATFAEPAIAALKTAGSLTDPQRAPYLFALLNEYSGALVMTVAVSVGCAVMLGILRLGLNWPLKRLVILVLLPCLGLTVYFALTPQYATVLGLAWDCGAVTTGPVTVPLVVALGLGVAAAAGKEDNPLAGFGIVTLASLFPALGVMGLTLALPVPDTGVPIAPVAAVVPAWHETRPWGDVFAALRAILPLTLLLWLIQRFMLREQIGNRSLLAYGIALAVLGMALFNLGLAYGLTPLGNQTGGQLPAAFARLAEIPESPLYPYSIGMLIVLCFSAVLGFGATIAEPALNAMGMTVQNLTNGAFPRVLLVRTVSAGVAAGIALGVVKILFDIPIAFLLVPGYGVALVLTLFSGEEFVNLAWDSAGVTTGPVTVPLVLAMGLGLGQAVDAVDGFGILALASVGPIISVLATGLWIRSRIAVSHEEEPEGAAA